MVNIIRQPLVKGKAANVRLCLKGSLFRIKVGVHGFKGSWFTVNRYEFVKLHMQKAWFEYDFGMKRQIKNAAASSMHNLERKPAWIP